MRMKHLVSLIAILSTATLLDPKPLVARTTATLTGRVTDSTGAVIPGVKIDATNTETNVTVSGETNSEGLYNIPDLPPGTYRVTVQKSTFRTIVKPNVELRVQDVALLNFSLQIGSVTESITVEEGTPLTEAVPQRGGNFLSREIHNLPLLELNAVSLARTLPGVMELKGSSVYGTGQSSFSVNGQRFRGNNYLLDGTENNDISQTGMAQRFTIVDAIEDVSVQTSNFGAEFGRAGGGIFNVVTKSGTNGFHGTLLWRYQSQRFNSVTNEDKLNQIPKSVFSHNVYGFTLGGPVRKDKTFFFGAFQQDTRHSTNNFDLVVPTEPAVGRLQSLFPSNPRLDLYLGLLGSLRGKANPFDLQLGPDPVTGADRGIVQFATAPLPLTVSDEGPQWLTRIDHSFSVKHRATLRYIYDSHVESPFHIFSPGFITDRGSQNQNFLLTDHYFFSPTWTNEFRFSYARQEVTQEQISPQSVSQAYTLPRISIANIATPGVPSNSIQFRRVNNWLLQLTQTKLSGRHTLRYGVEFLKQLAAQRPSAVTEGEVTYAAGGGYTAFANFLDDFSGPSGRWRRDFASKVFYPDELRQSYFFQDTWVPVPSLRLTLGLRYENFGQLANALPYPAFAGFDPTRFLEPNRVSTDNNNFGPSFGLAWTPSHRSRWLGKFLGENKTVFRGGFQVSYDALYTQMLSLLLAASSPNGISVNSTAAGTTPRGESGWFGRIPVEPAAASLLDSQEGVLDKNLRSPYTERWSFGFQRQLSSQFMLDGSYVGTVGHKLTTWSDLNPRQLNNVRVHPQFGIRHVRTSEGNSSYHAMQWRVQRRFAQGFLANASYTWSKYLDSTSEGIGAVVTQSQQRNLTSVPVTAGGLKLDRGPSDYDRTHRLAILYMWNIPGPLNGDWKYVLGGWSLGGVVSFQSGAPFTVVNGQGGDRNNDGFNNDRPDIGNPSAPFASRAVVATNCATGYRNPDTNECVNRGDVRWVQGTGLPNASTVGRNTLRAGSINNLDVTLTKAIPIGENRRLEFRWEAINALNHPQFTDIPARNVINTPISRFLNRDFTNSGNRTIWVQMRLVF